MNVRVCEAVASPGRIREREVPLGARGPHGAVMALTNCAFMRRSAILFYGCDLYGGDGKFSLGKCNARGVLSSLEAY